MKVWIVNPYGNLPDEGWREYRSTMIAEAFNKRGHEVVWWVSNFEHRAKIFRSNSWKDIQVNEKYLIKLVPSTSYIRHISLARIRHERNYAKNFRKLALEYGNKPDLIILGEPALFFSDIIVDVINKTKIPFIVDILDLWPELFNILLPNKLSFLGRFIFAPLYWRRSWLLTKASGIIGATQDYLKIGIAVSKAKYKEVIYLGIDLNYNISMNVQEGNKKILENIVKDNDDIWVIYAGTLGNNYDMKTIINCAKNLENLRLPIKIFIAGDGPLKVFIEDSIRINNLKKLVYIGRLNTQDLNYFYGRCDMALSSYVENSTVSMPVKAFDYLACGLPLINSLNRELGEIVVKHVVGLQYKSEDPEDMLRVIKILSADKNTLNLMKKNALNLAKSYDKHLQYDKLVTISENLIEDNKYNSPVRD
jgi:glycosyltransferase involved in cell wall biosynthesis